MIFAETNAPYLNRIQLVLTAPYVGPFVQAGPLGSFNPTRDLEVYVDGALIPVQTWSFDVVGNRYLLFMPQPINLQGVIQVVHRVPSPPFRDAGSLRLLGFALIATFSSSGDAVFDFLVQEDGTSEFIFESGLGAILLEI